MKGGGGESTASALNFNKFPIEPTKIVCLGSSKKEKALRSVMICRGIEWSLKIFNCSQNLAFARFARKI